MSRSRQPRADKTNALACKVPIVSSLTESSLLSKYTQRAILTDRYCRAPAKGFLKERKCPRDDSVVIRLRISPSVWNPSNQNRNEACQWPSLSPAVYFQLRDMRNLWRSAGQHSYLPANVSHSSHDYCRSLMTILWLPGIQSYAAAVRDLYWDWWRISEIASDLPHSTLLSLSTQIYARSFIWDVILLSRDNLRSYAIIGTRYHSPGYIADFHPACTRLMTQVATRSSGDLTGKTSSTGSKVTSPETNVHCML